MCDVKSSGPKLCFLCNSVKLYQLINFIYKKFDYIYEPIKVFCIALFAIGWSNEVVISTPMKYFFSRNKLICLLALADCQWSIIDGHLSPAYTMLDSAVGSTVYLELVLPTFSSVRFAINFGWTEPSVRFTKFLERRTELCVQFDAFSFGSPELLPNKASVRENRTNSRTESSVQQNHRTWTEPHVQFKRSAFGSRSGTATTLLGMTAMILPALGKIVASRH